MRSIGKYAIHGVLGRGGMGAVFRASAPVLGRVVALKLLRPNELTLGLWGRERVVRLFRDEAARLGSLRHQNLVDVFDYDDTGDWPFFVMDYYGESLGSVIGETYRVEAPSRRLPVPRAAGYAAQLLAGLGRLHHAGIVHRDVKPFNLLVSDDDVLKITDLGLSKLRGESFGGPANVKVGSPYYAAPEQEDDPDSADARADLYAVGVTLFRMLTGALPEWGEFAASGRVPELGDAFDGVLERSLCERPAGRYPDARAMAEALEAALAVWQRRMDGVCAASPESLCPRCVPEGAGLPRREPAMVGERQAREAFGLDQLWRPLAYWPGRLDAAGGGVLVDAATGLAWVREAAPYPTSWTGAAAYVQALNAGRFGGHGDWRLPTVAELMTLLSPEPVGAGYCQPSALSQPVRRVWSADRANYASAWAADVELGYVTRADFCCPAAARAVRVL
jgi:serine/threonine-protein kinase